MLKAIFLADEGCHLAIEVLEVAIELDSHVGVVNLGLSVTLCEDDILGGMADHEGVEREVDGLLLVWLVALAVAGSKYHHRKQCNHYINCFHN